jgi:hypothetical protein
MEIEMLVGKLTPEELTEEIERREKMGWVPTLTPDGIGFVMADARR